MVCAHASLLLQDTVAAQKISIRASIDISAVAAEKKNCLQFPYWLNCTFDSAAEVIEAKRDGEKNVSL